MNESSIISPRTKKIRQVRDRYYSPQPTFVRHPNVEFLRKRLMKKIFKVRRFKYEGMSQSSKSLLNFQVLATFSYIYASYATEL